MAGISGVGGSSGGMDGMEVALLAKNLKNQEKLATSLINDTLYELNKPKDSAVENMKKQFHMQTKVLGAALQGKGLNLDTIA